MTNIALKCICRIFGRSSRGEYRIALYYLLSCPSPSARYDIKIIPILVGAINQDKEKRYGELLAPYLAQEDTFCVVSSDFCHW